LAEKSDSSGKPLYGRNILEEVYRFAAKVALIAEEERFDVIHAHDWTTFPAAIAAKNVSGKPMIVHVHITEFDKTGGNHANPDVYRIEKEGMDQANLVITVSDFIRQRCIQSYFTDPRKIRVVHNAASSMDESIDYQGGRLKDKDKIVLFAGRVTLQKGPDYFIDAAKLVLEKDPNVTFILAGTGDMLPAMIQKAAAMGISHKFIFPGFYNRAEAEKLFSMADVFVMPSVSEPFGVVPYEAQIKKTPTIISKQSGISEVLTHCLKVDFWEVKELAGKILALLHYPTLNKTMTENGYWEAKHSTWDKPAGLCINLYQELCRT
jgi:glycosyltransferase involved in cell wall biosynthesis